MNLDFSALNGLDLPPDAKKKIADQFISENNLIQSVFDGNRLDKNLQDEFGQAGKLYFKSPKAIEFERYKQDCRKRALDLAHSQIQTMNSRGEISAMYQKNEKGGEALLTPASVIEDQILIGLADKYYNWLISIPEK